MTAQPWMYWKQHPERSNEDLTLISEPQSVSANPNVAVGPEEKAQLIEALRKANGNQSRAAGLLGVHRMTVFNRMRKYGITLKNNISWRSKIHRFSGGLKAESK